MRVPADTIEIRRNAGLPCNSSLYTAPPVGGTVAAVDFPPLRPMLPSALRMPSASAAPRSMIVPLIVACALFMENLDGTVITTALPDMAKSFGTSPIHLSLGITVYMFSLGIFIPMSGWVADRFGARTVFRAAIGVFTLGSILCGLTNGIVELSLARIIQGIGGAMMVPVGRLVLLRSVEKTDLVRAMAYLTVPALIGPVLGPPVGGFITTYLSWRWIFFLNLPIGLLGMVLVTFLWRTIGPTAAPPFDWLGFLLTGVALSAVMYDSDLVARPDVSGWVLGGLLVLGLAVGLWAVLYERRQAYPLVDLSLLKIPTFEACIWGALLPGARGRQRGLAPCRLVSA